MGSSDHRSAVLDPHRVAVAHRTTAVVADAEPDLVRLTRLARDLLGAAAAMVSVVDDERELLRATVGLPEGYGSGTTIPISLSLCVRIVRSGAPVVVPELRRDPVLQHHPVVAALELHSYAGVPLRVDGVVIGGFCVLGSTPRQWSADDLRLLHDLGSAVAAELELRTALRDLAAARDAERRLAAEQSALNRIATAVARGQSIDEVVTAAAGEVAALLSADSVVVVRFHRDGRAEAVAAAGPVPADASLCGALLATVRATGSAVADGGDVPCLAAPIAGEGGMWGALLAAGRTPPPGGLSQLTRLADLLALCVEKADAQARLVELSRTDPLTGAANRRAFTERLASELGRAQRYGTTTALALLDLDRFKQLNDEHGHLTGDRVLCELVARVTAQLRGSDVLARLGGDEFALVLPTTSYAGASIALERVRQAVVRAPMAGIPVTVTIGGVVPDPHLSADEVYAAADAALYRAKESGRGSLVLDRAR